MGYRLQEAQEKSKGDWGSLEFLLLRVVRKGESCSKVRENVVWWWWWWCVPIALAFQRQRQEDCDIKASLNIPARHFLSMMVIKVMVIMMVVVMI